MARAGDVDSRTGGLGRGSGNLGAAPRAWICGRASRPLGNGAGRRQEPSRHEVPRGGRTRGVGRPSRAGMPPDGSSGLLRQVRTRAVFSPLPGASASMTPSPPSPSPQDQSPVVGPLPAEWVGGAQPQPSKGLWTSGRADVGRRSAKVRLAPAQPPIPVPGRPSRNPQPRHLPRPAHRQNHLPQTFRKTSKNEVDGDHPGRTCTYFGSSRGDDSGPGGRTRVRVLGEIRGVVVRGGTLHARIGRSKKIPADVRSTGADV